MNRFIDAYADCDEHPSSPIILSPHSSDNEFIDDGAPEEERTFHRIIDNQQNNGGYEQWVNYGTFGTLFLESPHRYNNQSTICSIRNGYLVLIRRYNRMALYSLPMHTPQIYSVFIYPISSLCKLTRIPQ